MESMTSQEVTALAAETGLHWNTCYKWSRDNSSVAAGAKYALKAASEKLGIEVGDDS